MWRIYLDAKLRKIPPHNLCVGKVEDQGVANKEVPRPIIVCAFGVVGGAAPNFPRVVSILPTWHIVQTTQLVSIMHDVMHVYAPIPLFSSSPGGFLEIGKLSHNFRAAT